MESRKQNPILHITRSDLSVILNKLLPEDVNLTDFVDRVFSSANRSKVQLKAMYRFKSSNKTKKKGDRSQEANSTKVETFNRLLAGVRTKLRNSGVAKPIAKTDSDYLLLKEVVMIAIDFHERAASSNLEQSFLFFIEQGIDLMRNKYALGKFKYYKDKIYDRWIVKSIINNDNAPAESKRFYTIWRRIVKKYAPGYIDIESEQDYTDIILARMEADELKATYDDWIMAQFEGLSFLDSIPNFNQLYGMNAKKRYQEFVSNKSYRKKGEQSEGTADFESDEQKAYFELLRQNRSVD